MTYSVIATNEHIAAILDHAQRHVARGSSLTKEREYMHYQLVQRVQNGELPNVDPVQAQHAHDDVVTIRTKALFIEACTNRAALLYGEANSLRAEKRAALKAKRAAEEAAPDFVRFPRHDLETGHQQAETLEDIDTALTLLRRYDDEIPAGTVAQVATQCEDHAGRVGCFLFQRLNGERVAISPVFANLSDLFDWCKSYRWTTTNADTYTRQQPIHVETDARKGTGWHITPLNHTPGAVAELVLSGQKVGNIVWSTAFVAEGGHLFRVQLGTETHGFNERHAALDWAAHRLAELAGANKAANNAPMIEEYRTAVISTAHMMPRDYDILAEHAIDVATDNGLFWVHDTPCGAILRFSASHDWQQELTDIGASVLLITTINALESLGFHAAHFDRDADTVTGLDIDPQQVEA